MLLSIGQKFSCRAARVPEWLRELPQEREPLQSWLRAQELLLQVRVL